ncbi:hypothetical protein FUT63_01045 [Extensimonas vulgaris]|nr:hypothetical protein FUT63_01045 [Extensimonas vulgaris]
MQILAIPPGIAAVCALPRPKIHRFYLSLQASNTALATGLSGCFGCRPGDDSFRQMLKRLQ